MRFTLRRTERPGSPPTARPILVTSRPREPIASVEDEMGLFSLGRDEVVDPLVRCGLTSAAESYFIHDPGHASHEVL